MPEPGRMPRLDPLAVTRARWAEQTLPGDPWPFLATGSLSRLHQIVSRALDDRLKPFELSRTGYFLLTTLSLIKGERARLGTLSRYLMIHPTTVTLTVDQLERAGLVTRERHPHDRRATLVRLTGSELERVRQANAALQDDAAEGPLGELTGRYRKLFEALQEVRAAVGDTDF